MWVYQKMLQYPAGVTTTCPRLAKDIITQYGGPDGELAASMRYLTQRYSMPIPQAKAVLTDIGTEESVPGSYKLSMVSVESSE
jgi:spore coat protein JC